MADDQQFEPLGQILTPQTLAMMRYQQQQRMMDQAAMLPGAQYAARIGGLSAGASLGAAFGGPQGIDRLAAQNQGMIDASGVANGASAPVAPAAPGAPQVSPMESQAQNYERLAAMLSKSGQSSAAAMMQDKANALRQLDANLGKTQADTYEAMSKGDQAVAERNKANRFSVWKQDPDQTGVAPNKTRYVDVNGYAAPEIRDQGNLPDYTMSDMIVPLPNGGNGTQSVVYDKHNGRIIKMDGIRPYVGTVNTDVAKDLAKRISTIYQGRVAMAQSDRVLNDAVGFQAVAAQHGGNIANIFIPGSVNPTSTQAISTVDAGNQLARAALRVTGRYANAQDKQINELLPETEGLLGNAQHERTKLWGTEEQLAGEESILRQNYQQLMGNDTRALPPAIPTLRQRDMARKQAAARAAQGPAAPQGPVPGQDAGSATPDNPRGQVGRPANPPPQASDNAPAGLPRGTIINYVRDPKTNRLVPQ